jgi:hypothetical protein
MKPRSWALVVFSTLGAAVVTAVWHIKASDPAQLACEQDVRSLTDYLEREPLRAAAESAAKGDLRYLGVHGFTVTYPGTGACLQQEDLGEAISGTSDAICSDRHLRLRQRAIEFAKTYNAAINEHRGQRKLPACTA